MNRIIFLIISIVISASILFSWTRFTDNGNETISDNGTGLLWQKCSAGKSGTNCITGTASTYTWENALTYCEGLTFAERSNWRLPNINELKSIIDYSTYNPAINGTYFPETTPLSYWSSSIDVLFTAYAWDVRFINGFVASMLKTTSSSYVRCVSGP